ncbi:nucleolar transcription factor 1-B-like [Littorina saxatilis]|uniref:Uncharacterized protein n=1 Tax=Littorina saxatilis TaxID=31220 RepID=A0AAN9B6B5_9CAEN
MSSDLQTRLTEAEKSFKKACEQIVQLNRRLDEMAKRYEKASRENHRSFRYSLRLRMAVTEGVRNMYYEYAANKADDITHLRCDVLREVGDGNQPSTDGQDGENRAEEEEGGGEESNPIADLEEVGDMLGNRLLNDSGASDSAMQEDEEEEEDSTSDMQEDLAGSVEEADNEFNDMETLDHVPSPVLEEVMRVSSQMVQVPSTVTISRVSNPSTL